jgi:LysM repeat protein
MNRTRKVFLLISVFALVLLMPFISAAEDDFALPPPPDASDEMLPPPPGDDMAAGDEALPPPPGDEGSADMGADMPPPPAEEEAAGDVPPPPAEEGGELAPPPAEEASNDAPPPPDEEEMAPPPMEDETASSEEPAKVSKKSAGGKYAVKNGDSLWRISGKSTGYGDSFKWPLLFKANRDIIEDPDLIYPRQKLEVKKSYTEAEMDDAVGKAKETPAFEPHSVPRKKLPIKY